MVTLISNTGGGATVPATGLPEGSILFAGNAPFTIAYNAGAGHDVVLTTAVGQVSLGATLVGGKLTISDTSANGRPSHTSVIVELPAPGFPGQLVVNDDLDFFAAAPAGGTLGNSNHGFSLPLAKVTQGVVINAGGGDDVLILRPHHGRQAADGRRDVQRRRPVDRLGRPVAHRGGQPGSDRLHLRRL